MPSPSYPWKNLQVYFDDLMRQFGLSDDEAKQQLDRLCRTGRLEIRPLDGVTVAAGASATFRIAAYGQLRIETSEGLFAADRFEVRDRPISAKPGLLGRNTPMDPVTHERLKARIRELGGAYIISSTGAGFLLPEPASAPAPMPANKAASPSANPEKLPPWLKRVDSHFQAEFNRQGVYPSRRALVDSVRLRLKKLRKPAPRDDRTIERALTKYRSHWFKSL